MPRRTPGKICRAFLRRAALAWPMNWGQPSYPADGSHRLHTPRPQKWCLTSILRCFAAAFAIAALAATLAQPAAAQPKKPDTDSESPIVNRALRFSGEQPPYSVFVQFPWFAGEGIAPVASMNSTVARTVLDWVQQFSSLYARGETDPSWRERRKAAKLEVEYRLLRPTQRLLCVVYTRTFNDGRMDEDRVLIATDLFDMTTWRPIELPDLLAGEQWQKPVAEAVEQQLRDAAARRGVTLFASLRVRDWLKESDRWQFDRTGATLHFGPGDVAPETAGRFEALIPYAVFAGSIRRNSALGRLAPRDPPPVPAHDAVVPPRR